MSFLRQQLGAFGLVFPQSIYWAMAFRYRLPAIGLSLLAIAGPLSAQNAPVDRLIDAGLADTSGYARLAKLTDTFGHRLSGSKALESAIDWILAEMRRDGLASVRGEPVMVPHWVRGEESAALVSPRASSL